MFGENLKRAREAAGMSQSEFAEKMSVRTKDIERWESGNGSPDCNFLDKRQEDK